MTFRDIREFGPYWERNEYGGYGRIAPVDRCIVIAPNPLFATLWPRWHVDGARIRRDLTRSNRRIEALAAAARTLHVEVTYP